MKLLVDTSVWSLAMRRDQSEGHPSVDFLADALRHEGSIFTTGLILQEILQGFSGPKARKQILDRFTPLPLIVPQREDHTAGKRAGRRFSKFLAMSLFEYGAAGGRSCMPGPQSCRRARGGHDWRPDIMF